MDTKIRQALLIALRAMPQVIRFPVSDLERYRVCKSADVTAYCRHMGILALNEYVSYTAWYPPDPSYGPAKLIPSVRDDGSLVAYLPEGEDAERDLDVPVDQELRAKFLSIKEPHHPLALHQRQSFSL